MPHPLRAADCSPLGAPLRGGARRLSRGSAAHRRDVVSPLGRHVLGARGPLLSERCVGRGEREARPRERSHAPSRSSEQACRRGAADEGAHGERESGVAAVAERKRAPPPGGSFTRTHTTPGPPVEDCVHTGQAPSRTEAAQVSARTGCASRRARRAQSACTAPPVARSRENSSVSRGRMALKYELTPPSKNRYSVS